MLAIGGDESAMALLATLLEQRGIALAVARNGNDGLEQARRSPPDVILLDLATFAGMGFDYCQQLKRDPRTADIPVMLMTVPDSLDDRIRGFEAGAVDCLAMPCPMAEVAARVQAQCAASRRQRRLREQNDRLLGELAAQARLAEERDTFAHTVIHDVKAPVANLQMMLAMLVEELPESVDEHLAGSVRTCLACAEQANNIIRELLLLASLGQSEVTLMPLDMGKIVKDTLQRVAPEMAGHPPVIVCQENWPSALGRPGWVEEIWYNYLTNAWKYGGRPPHIYLGADAPANGLVRFWVQDNGAGLTEDERIRVFAPFVRLERIRAEGHGLGLSVVRSVAEKLGGRVGVTSRPGSGARFYFELPVDPGVAS